MKQKLNNVIKRKYKNPDIMPTLLTAVAILHISRKYLNGENSIS